MLMLSRNVGLTFCEVVRVTAPDANVSVVTTELNVDSTPACMPVKMPCCADADRAPARAVQRVKLQS